MTGLGLLALPAQTRFEICPGPRMSGFRVVVLGGGLAGLTIAPTSSARSVTTAGCSQARATRAARVFTVRRGTVSEEDGPGPDGGL